MTKNQIISLLKQGFKIIFFILAFLFNLIIEVFYTAKNYIKKYRKNKFYGRYSNDKFYKWEQTYEFNWEFF